VIAEKTKDLDYVRPVRASKKLNVGGARQRIRIALLSDAASQPFAPLLQTLLLENAVAAEIYEGPFDAMEREALNPQSDLCKFAPDIIVLANATQALRTRYYHHAGDGIVEAESHRVEHIWNALEEHSSARIIQFNYPLPPDSQFGNYDLKVPQSLRASVYALNERIAARAREHSNVLLCDVEGIASYVGRKYWFDERLWNMTKTFCALEHLPLVAQAVVDIVLSTTGRVVKCVVLDLDNTLWGGVVGDDGPLGIAIDSHGDGEAFHHFQLYLLSLKKRGVLLAVCSKNDAATALRPFIENPHMVLKRDDITVFVANWESKAENIRTIRDTLGIGLDSMVFLDDNPFERNAVRGLLPAVIVPDLPEDPADYVRAVSELNLFETNSFSAEDVARSQLYKQEAGRRELRSTFANLDDFMQSLEMKIEVRRFEPDKIARIAQLIQRSNQFNLTTRRYNQAECMAMAEDREHFLPLFASLKDRLSDHGLIAVVIVKMNGDQWEISDLLMSCRALARGVEHFLMNRVVALAERNAVRGITAEFIPTTNNSMVKDFFVQFGFSKVADEGGRTTWRLDPAAYRGKRVFIEDSEAKLRKPPLSAGVIPDAVAAAGQ